MAQVKDSLVGSSVSEMVRQNRKRRDTIIIIAAVLAGLVLARFMRISLTAAFFVLSSGIVLAITVLVRKTDYLLIAWVILTTFVEIFMTRFFPGYYFSVGRAIFWGLLGCVVVAWALENILRGRQFIPFDNVPLKATILIFLLWCTLSLSTSEDLFNSAKQLAKFVIVFVTSYMFYNFFCQNENNIKKLLNIVSLLVITVSFITVAVALKSLISGTAVYKRITLWWVNPNMLGMFLFMCSPILIVAGFDFIHNRGLRIFLIGIMLLALFFSFHRTSWLGASVSILFLLSRNRMKIPVWLAVAAGLFLSAVLLPVFGDDVYDYLTGPRYTGRIEIWKGAWKTACDHPVLGTGPGTSISAISQYIVTPWLRNSDTHSAYLRNAVEMGFASVVIMLASYVMFLYFSWKIEKNLKSHYLKAITRGTTATLLGLLAHGIFECGFFMTTFSAAEFTVIWPYILITMPFAAKRLEEREKSG